MATNPYGLANPMTMLSRMVNPALGPLGFLMNLPELAQAGGDILEADARLVPPRSRLASGLRGASSAIRSIGGWPSAVPRAAMNAGGAAVDYLLEDPSAAPGAAPTAPAASTAPAAPSTGASPSSLPDFPYVPGPVLGPVTTPAPRPWMPIPDTYVGLNFPGTSPLPIPLRGPDVPVPPPEPAGYAAQMESKMRAVRLPSGRIVFTNTPEEYEGKGEGMSYLSAVRAKRDEIPQDAAASALTGILRAQVNQEKLRTAKARRQGRSEEITEADLGAYSTPGGTPEIRTQQALEDAARETALLEAKTGIEQARARLAIAGKSPFTQLALGQPDVVREIAFQFIFGPRMAEVQDKLSAEVARIQADGSLNPRQKQEQIDNAQAMAETELQNIQAQMAYGARQRPVFPY